MLAGISEFEGPVSGARIISDTHGNFTFDPTFEELRNAHLDLTIAGTLDAITMVESQGQEVSNDLMIRAFEYAHGIIRELCEAQNDFIALYKKSYDFSPVSLVLGTRDPAVIEEVHTLVTGDMIQALYGLGKLEFHDALHDLFEATKAKMIERWI